MVQRQRTEREHFVPTTDAVDSWVSSSLAGRLAGSAFMIYATRTPPGSSTTGVPPNMVQRVMGHERASTTLDRRRY
jgi:hypothetical protein